MMRYRPRILMLSGPVEPPWTRGDKNLVRGIASHLDRYRARVLTHEGVVGIDSRYDQEPAWGPQGGGHTPLSRRLGLFSHLIQTGDAVLVHLLWPPDMVVANVVRAACRVRALPVIHTLVRAPQTTLGLRHAVAGDTVVCLTDATLARVRREGITDAICIPPGVAVGEPVAHTELAAIRRRYGIPQGPPLVTYAGDYRHSFAARTVAATVPRIVREVDAHFVFACRIRDDRDLAEESRIRAAIAADGLADRVTFINEVKSLRDLFAISAVQVFPADSHQEKIDMPLVLLEGMAEGLATVVARKPPLSELVDAGAALGVPACHPVALAVAVVELLREEPRRLELAQRARALALERFEVRRVAAAYEALYDRVLGRTDRAVPLVAPAG